MLWSGQYAMLMNDHAMRPRDRMDCCASPCNLASCYSDGAMALRGGRAPMDARDGNSGRVQRAGGLPPLVLLHSARGNNFFAARPSVFRCRVLPGGGAACRQGRRGRHITDALSLN